MSLFSWVSREFANRWRAGLTGLTFAIALPALLMSDAGAQQQPVWLMGEVHDNSDGHDYRLRDLQHALHARWRPAILMEQFDVERQAELTRAWQTCADAQCVIDAASGPGWDWVLYEPLIQMALDARLPLVAANVSREQLMRVMKEGFEAVFDQDTIEAYGLDQPYEGQWLEQQRTAMREGHCNLLPEKMIDPMVNAQAARDVMFAKLIAQYADQGVVLIAGNGHVRKDLGVYVWLEPELRGNTTIYGYVEAGAASTTNYDRVRLVPPQSRADPCEVFRRARQSP